MKCRGYGLSKRTNYSDYIPITSDIVFVVITIICDIVVIAGSVNGVTFTLYNPYFMINEIDLFAIVTFICYGFLCILPFVLDLRYNAKLKIREQEITGGKQMEAA